MYTSIADSTGAFSASIGGLVLLAMIVLAAAAPAHAAPNAFFHIQSRGGRQRAEEETVHARDSAPATAHRC